eukprot:scaffold48928_cov25-Tisochrysis_lutea.AAC.3
MSCHRLRSPTYRVQCSRRVGKDARHGQHLERVYGGALIGVPPTRVVLPSVLTSLTSVAKRRTERASSTRDSDGSTQQNMATRDSSDNAGRSSRVNVDAPRRDRRALHRRRRAPRLTRSAALRSPLRGPPGTRGCSPFPLRVRIALLVVPEAESRAHARWPPLRLLPSPWRARGASGGAPLARRAGVQGRAPSPLDPRGEVGRWRPRPLRDTSMQLRRRAQCAIETSAR